MLISQLWRLLVTAQQPFRLTLRIFHCGLCCFATGKRCLQAVVQRFSNALIVVRCQRRNRILQLVTRDSRRWKFTCIFFNADVSHAARDTVT